MRQNQIPVPQSLQHLKTDSRGYPIFATVTVMRDGTPDFRVVDQQKAYDFAMRKLCGLSGLKLDRKKGAVFVGGPLSAFASGKYADPPMLQSAAFYALRVCPYLSAPRWADREFKERGGGLAGGIIAHDDRSVDQRPPVFVAVKARKWKVTGDGRTSTVTFQPEWPYLEVSFWTNGGQKSYEEAIAIDPRLPDLAQIEEAGVKVLRPDDA
jgi:hypothetical protein